jgi:hypothetical protein
VDAASLAQVSACFSRKVVVVVYCVPKGTVSSKDAAGGKVLSLDPRNASFVGTDIPPLIWSSVSIDSSRVSIRVICVMFVLPLHGGIAPRSNLMSQV